MTNFGFIGAGGMGKCHASLLNSIGGTRVAGIYDPVTGAATEFAGLYSAKVFKSAEDLSRSPEIDAILICSPAFCHAPQVKLALESCKPVFCEKPLCLNAGDAAMLLALQRKYQQPFGMGFCRRMMSPVKRMKELLEAGTIGRIRFFNVDFPYGVYRRVPPSWFTDFDKCGGVIIDMLAHHVDLANWFFGPAQRVYADGLLLDPSQPEPADYVAAVVTYDNGVIGNFMCNWQRFGRVGGRMEIYGENGSLTLDETQTLIYEPKNGVSQSVDIPENDMRLELILNFVESIRTGCQPAATLQDGFNSLQVGLAMIESVRTRQVVELSATAVNNNTKRI